ncbi:hypothetical protein ARMSODRAFT_339087 [Armillaria solidipes]|uniref:Uncharacterized protein n=1 Tax=Armillaria solidipes TaxID=1076256 RepID=A0A2H3BTB1_9AGAR|nr:hypothetical protein ARMSODRAFT_339087 [Armillaria solidipes]
MISNDGPVIVKAERILPSTSTFCTHIRLWISPCLCIPPCSCLRPCPCIWPYSTPANALCTTF